MSDLSKRTFLDSDGLACAEISLDAIDYAMLTISDGNSKVRIGFELGTHRRAKADKAKLNKLLSVISVLVDAYNKPNAN